MNVMSLPNTLSFILRHPLNKGQASKALSRFLSWQYRSRTVGADIVPFVDDTRLMVRKGMTSATAQHYCGLADFEEMGFVLHALRSGDLFYDIGANVGCYTVLASVTGANVIAFEPCPSTFRSLLTNLSLNGIGKRVYAHPVALGAKPLTMMFTENLDSVNHVVSDGESAKDAVPVPVKRLDDYIIPNWGINVLKIDVEGFEAEVLKGGRHTFSKASAVILELLNGAGCRYGFDDWKLHAEMLGMGFKLHRYDPFSRELKETDEIIGGNNLYVKDAEILRERVLTAPKHLVHGRWI
jgi:FkbM family methyltransferase